VYIKIEAHYNETGSRAATRTTPQYISLLIYFLRMLPSGLHSYIYIFSAT